MSKNEYSIQELIQRPVYIGDMRVGVVVGERIHPNTDRVRSMRIQVEGEVAEEYMRKSADIAPLGKDLVHSIRDDGGIKLTKSIRELQRRWRNTIRVSDKLYAPDELIDRAVIDSDGVEVGIISDLVKVKRTYKGVEVKVRSTVQRDLGIEEFIKIPICSFQRTRDSMDDIVLSRTMKKLINLPSYENINLGIFEDE